MLTTLAGRATYGNTVGTIEINGVPDSLLKYPKLVGFVPQEDVMHRDCTVEEVFAFLILMNISHIRYSKFFLSSFVQNLLFSARTRLPAKMSFAEQRAFVDQVIQLLGLSELRNSVIGDEGKAQKEKYEC